MDYSEFQKSINISGNFERRKTVLNYMANLIDQEKNCSSCQGMCCTFAYNSMQVTPAEALDAYDYLISQNRVNQALIDRLEKCIKEYRLDNEINLGRGRELRRTYTCPFYNAGSKGCGIAPESKPYGCLAFNPKEKNVSTEGKCKSYTEVLEKREADYSGEEALNYKIIHTLNLGWEKKNFPQGLLSIIHKFF